MAREVKKSKLNANKYIQQNIQNAEFVKKSEEYKKVAKDFGDQIQYTVKVFDRIRKDPSQTFDLAVVKAVFDNGKAAKSAAFESSHNVIDFIKNKKSVEDAIAVLNSDKQTLQTSQEQLQKSKDSLESSKKQSQDNYLELVSARTTFGKAVSLATSSISMEDKKYQGEQDKFNIKIEENSKQIEENFNKIENFTKQIAEFDKVLSLHNKALGNFPYGGKAGHSQNLYLDFVYAASGKDLTVGRDGNPSDQDKKTAAICFADEQCLSGLEKKAQVKVTKTLTRTVNKMVPNEVSTYNSRSGYYERLPVEKAVQEQYTEEVGAMEAYKESIQAAIHNPLIFADVFLNGPEAAYQKILELDKRDGDKVVEEKKPETVAPKGRVEKITESFTKYFGKDQYKETKKKSVQEDNGYNSWNPMNLFRPATETISEKTEDASTEKVAEKVTSSALILATDKNFFNLIDDGYQTGIDEFYSLSKASCFKEAIEINKGYSSCLIRAEEKGGAFGCSAQQLLFNDLVNACSKIYPSSPLEDIDLLIMDKLELAQSIKYDSDKNTLSAHSDQNLFDLVANQLQITSGGSSDATLMLEASVSGHVDDSPEAQIDL